MRTLIPLVALVLVMFQVGHARFQNRRYQPHRRANQNRQVNVRPTRQGPEDYKKYLRNFVCPALQWIGDATVEDLLMRSRESESAATVTTLLGLYNDPSRTNQADVRSIWERGCFRMVKLLNADINVGGSYVEAINYMMDGVTEDQYNADPSIGQAVQAKYIEGFNDIAPAYQHIAAPFEDLCVTLMGGGYGFVFNDHDYSLGPKC